MGRYLNVSHEEYSEGIVCWIVCPDYFTYIHTSQRSANYTSDKGIYMFKVMTKEVHPET